MSEIYQISSIKKIVCLFFSFSLNKVIKLVLLTDLQPTDPTLYPQFSLDVVSSPSSSSDIIAPLCALSFGYITSDIPDWIIAQSANDFWNFLGLYPNLRLWLLVLGVIVKLFMGWVQLPAAKQNEPRIPR